MPTNERGPGMRLSSGPEHALLTNRPVIVTQSVLPSSQPLPLRERGSPYSVVCFQPDGRMYSVICDGRAEMPAGELRQFISYAGNYTFDGTTLTTRVDASSDASRIGGDQVRNVRFENGGMVLAPPRRLYAGVMQRQELLWEQVG